VRSQSLDAPRHLFGVRARVVGFEPRTASGLIRLTRQCACHAKSVDAMGR
jgi:hypothetical protein